jgi:hypothetical protein
MATRPQSRPSVLGRVLSVVVGRLDGYPIDTRRCVMEHRSALSSRVALAQPFEGVIQDVIGVGHLINREVAFEPIFPPNPKRQKPVKELNLLNKPF